MAIDASMNADQQLKYGVQRFLLRNVLLKVVNLLEKRCFDGYNCGALKRMNLERDLAC